MRELHLLKNAVSPRRERNFGAPQGRDNAEMELGWDRVGLRLGPMLAYVGLSWPTSGLVWTYSMLVLRASDRYSPSGSGPRGSPSPLSQSLPGAGVAKGGGLSFGSPGPLG